MLIGLTGTYCAGKNYVADILQSRGLSVLDVDKLGYQVLDLEKEAICAEFGPDLKKEDGSLDRNLLGKRVFGKPEKLALLESIVHPAANRMTEKWVEKESKKGHCVINAALLHKSSVFNKLDKIILVSSPLLTRAVRARRRDKLSWLEIFRRFKSQKTFHSQYFTSNAEIHRVENLGLSGSHILREKLERRINAIIEGCC